MLKSHFRRVATHNPAARSHFTRFSCFAALAALCLASTGMGQNLGSAPPSADSPLKLDFNLFGGAPDSGGNHIQFSGSFTVEKESRRGTLTLSADIDPGWHVYSLTQVPGGPQKSQIKVTESKSYQQLGPFQPDKSPHIKPPDVFKVPSEEHEGKINWTAPLELAEGVDAEKLAVVMTFSGQVCDAPQPLGNGVCIPIFGEKVTAKFAGYITKSAKAGEFRPTEDQGQVVFKGAIEPAAVAPGGKIKLSITAEPNPGWHIYAYAPKDPDVVGANKPTLIYLPPLTGWKRSSVETSNPPTEKPARLKGVPPERSHGAPVTWTIELTAPSNSPTGETIISGFLGYQTCDENSCLAPQALQFRASVPIKAQPQNGQIPLEFTALERSPGDGQLSGYKYVASLADAAPAATAAATNWRALLPMIGFGLLGGLILNLMPCVLPVIGLKLLSLVQHAGHSRAKIFALNLWFSLGLLTVFFVLAMLAAVANLGWGQQFTYTWFKVAMVVVVFAFALSFLGVWEIPIPGFAQSSTSSQLQHQEGAAGAYFKGIFTTLLATPCSGPFLGPVFAFTLALMMAVWLACWIIGQVPVYEEAGKQLRQWGIALAAATAIGWLSFTCLGPVRHLYEWKPFSPQTVAQLQSEGKTVMVDFTADWCLTCQVNFRTAINTHRVKDVVEKNGVVPVLADWSDYNETIKQQLTELKSNSIPLMVIYPASSPNEPIILRDALLESQVIAALKEAGPSSAKLAGEPQIKPTSFDASLH